MTGPSWTECIATEIGRCEHAVAWLGADSGSAIGGRWPMVCSIAWIAVPILLTPLGVLLLRPLFAIFLEEGAELFSDAEPRRSLCRAIGHYLAVFNVAIFVVAWCACCGCRLLEWPKVVGAAVAVVGVITALATTIHLVRKFLGLAGRPAILVGLMAFGGGNLPLFIIVPAIMALT